MNQNSKSPTRPNEHIAITGASSFTGSWLGYFLWKRGYRVSGLARVYKEVEMLKNKRLRNLSGAGANVHYGLDAVGNSYVEWLKNNRADVWIHHHFHTENFRSESYDRARAKLVATGNLSQLISTLKSTGCRLFIYSGSYFEAHDPGLKLMSDKSSYAEEKRLAWELVETTCRERSLPVLKIEIPNTFGPLENEERLVPSLIRSSFKRTSFQLKFPNVVTPNIQMDSLAETYAKAINEALREGVKTPVVRPVAFEQCNLHFVTDALRELVTLRLGLQPCPLDYPVNPVGSLECGCSQMKRDGQFWDWYAKVYRMVLDDQEYSK